MALTVATNTGALMAQAAASSVNKEMEMSMERLSTGKRINGASDDAAGVAIASRLTAEIKGTNQAIRNAMDGQALIDTAEGAHQEIESILQRMRELAVQAANDTNDANDRSNLQLEIDQLTTEIDRISSTTSWAGKSLIDGTGSFAFQVGSKTTASDSISTTLNSMSSSGLGIASPDSATAISGVTGVTQSGSDFTAVSTANFMAVQYGDTTINAGIESVSATGATVSIEGDQLVITVSAGDGADASVTLNGKTYTATLTGAGNSEKTTAATAIATAIENDYAWATKEDDDSSGAAAFAVAVSVNKLIEELATDLNANADFAAKFTANGTASAGTLSISTDAVAPSLSVGAITHGTGASNTNVAVTNNTMTVTALTGTPSDTLKSTFTITVGGQDVAFDTDLDGADKGYNVNNQASLTEAIIQKLEDANIGNTTFTNSGSGVITVSNGGSVDLSSMSNAQSAIKALDVAIQTVNNQRATLGAVSNRLDSTVSNLTNISSNLEAGRGRIEDADFAAETTSLAKSQILQQASTAMLAQANASKQNVLSLLQG